MRLFEEMYWKSKFKHLFIDVDSKNFKVVHWSEILEVPLTLLSLASYIEKIDYKVKFLDLGLHAMKNWERVLKAINTRFIGLSCYTQDFGYTIDLVTYIRKFLPGVKFVLGGPHVSFTDKQTLKYSPVVDYVVRDEGEETLAELLDYSEKKVERIHGLTFRDGQGRIIRNPPRNRKKEPIEIPMPAYHLLPQEYKDVLYVRARTSRGCPMKCIFCANIFKMWPISKSKENIIGDFEAIKRFFNSNYIYITDDTFGIDRKQCSLLLDVLKDIDFNWFCQTRVDLINRSFLDKMKESGCIGINVGVESSTDRILKKIQKGVTFSQTMKALKLIKEYDMNIATYWIIGLPGEKTEDIERTLQSIMSLISKDLSHQVELEICVPYPGTPMYNEPHKYGIEILTYDWSKYRQDGPPVFETQNLKPHTVFKLWKKGIRIINSTMKKKVKIYD